MNVNLVNGQNVFLYIFFDPVLTRNFPNKNFFGVNHVYFSILISVNCYFLTSDGT